MLVKKLDTSFYVANTHLINALDLVNGQWLAGKARGYGIIILSINNHTFAVPLRSSIKHQASFPTVGKHGATHKGMDFSKALLITQPSYISNDVFKIPPNEYSKIKGKAHYIQSRFEKYVTRYIKAAVTNDAHVLGTLDFAYTTLVNYHNELGITQLKLEAAALALEAETAEAASTENENA